MKKYTPDSWVILNVPGVGNRILAGWYDPAWRLSSQVQSIHDLGKYYTIKTKTGSIYTCSKDCMELSGYTSAIYEYILTLMDGIRLLKNDEILKC